MAALHNEGPAPHGRAVAIASRSARGVASQCRARDVFARACASWLGTVLLLACAGSPATANGPDERYPEKKRPEPLRWPSDGEVMGAQEQDPADTLAGSLTNEHPAPRSPHAETPAEEAHERLEYEQCIEASKSALAPGADPRKRPVCPPPREDATPE